METLGKTLKLKSPVSPTTQVGHHNVVNLSDYFVPTGAQLKLLSKGLTFIPTYKLDVNQKKQISMDLQTYHRRLKLPAFYEGRESTVPLPFMPKSDWVPKNSQLLPPIRNIVRADQYALDNLHWDQKDTFSLSVEEIDALQVLQNNTHIVLKPADKGSSVVILDRTQYIWEAERQLSNQEHYKKLNSSIYLQTISMVEEVLENLKKEGYINEKQKTYLKGSGNPNVRINFCINQVE